jgi:hypothetical protein
MTDIQRFWVKVDTSGKCWLWKASITPDGYGQFKCNGKVIRPHRWSYEHFIGIIPEGLELDHLCSVPACVRPSHLEAVTHKENIRRGLTGIVNRSKTVCKQGHTFTHENTGIRSNGSRYCKTCHREYYHIHKK